MNDQFMNYFANISNNRTIINVLNINLRNTELGIQF